MLFVLLCFAMDNICDVHNCNGKDIRSIIAKQQETPGKLILKDSFLLIDKTTTYWALPAFNTYKRKVSHYSSGNSIFYI